MSTALKNKINNVMTDTAKRASSMMSVLVDSQFNADGYIKDPQKRDDSIADAAMVEGSIYASMGEKDGKEIAIIHASAIREYEHETGEYPSEALLANVHTTLENLYSGQIDSKDNSSLLASLNADSMSTTKGIDIRRNTAAITLPAILMNVTNELITYIPNPRKEETEIFNVERVAGSTFGGMTKGDIINQMSSGSYTRMRRKFETSSQPDGTAKQFTFDTATDGMGKAAPMVAGKVQVIVNKKRVAKDDGNGAILGVISSNNAVTGTVDCDTGVVSIETAQALPAGATVEIRFEVDIEAAPDFIPLIDHKMQSWTLRPTQRVIAAEASIMAMFTASNEYGMNLRSMNLQAMRETVADEKAKMVLEDIYEAIVEQETFDADKLSNQQDWLVEAEKLRNWLDEVSSGMLGRNEESGLTGMYCGKRWASLFRSLPKSMFQPVAGYKQKPSIHFCGTLFDRYRIYEVPQESIVPADEFVGYAKSTKIGKCGYLSGDVVPATLYSHEVTRGLRKADTLWALGYDEVHPNNGENFFVKGKLQNLTLN